MKYVVTYEEYGDNNLETWTLYSTEIHQLPDEIDDNFISKHFVQIAQSHNPFDGNFDAYYERIRNHTTYIRLQ